MHVTRERVAVAFETCLQQLLSLGVPTKQQPFKTVSRKFQTYTDTDPSLQPALYIMEHDEDQEQRQVLGLYRYKLRRFLFVYCINTIEDPNAPSTLLNNLIDAIEGAISPIPGQAQTLQQFDPLNLNQDLVTNVWIDGTIIIAEGFTQPQAIARIPVSIQTGV